MIRFMTLVLAIVLVGGGSQAMAQTLWGNAEYGMSVDQASKAVPGAYPAVGGGTLKGGAKELLQTKEISVAERNFVARLYFIDKRLDQVTLSLVDDLPTASAVSLYDRLVTTLRAKYGKELNGEASGGFMLRKSHTWVSGATNVSLILIAIGNNTPLINVNYQVRVSKDADKL